MSAFGRPFRGAGARFDAVRCGKLALPGEGNGARKYKGLGRCLGKPSRIDLQKAMDGAVNGGVTSLRSVASTTHFISAPTR
jgi:hypothetical protein